MRFRDYRGLARRNSRYRRDLTEYLQGETCTVVDTTHVLENTRAIISNSNMESALLKAMRRFVPVMTVVASLTCSVTAFAQPFAISTSYNNLLSNPEHTGMLDRIITEAFGRIRVPCELVFTETE